MKNRFTYHEPNEDQAKRYAHIRGRALALAELMNNYCPDSRELSLAFTKLEEAVMWAKKAIEKND
jgi:hypothetical protein